MDYPYGEWIIFFLALATWAEKRTSRHFFLVMMIAWLIGKCVEVVFPSTLPWNWHFARLAVLLAFWVWAWQRDGRRILPLLFTSLVLSLETLLIVNEPGVIPYGLWVFTLGIILVAWLTGKSYWGTAAAFSGSILVNQALVRFTHEGIVRYADFPDAFVWNFGVAFFAIWAGFLVGFQYYTERKGKAQIVEHQFPGKGVKTYEQEKQELQ